MERIAIEVHRISIAVSLLDIELDDEAMSATLAAIPAVAGLTTPPDLRGLVPGVFGQQVSQLVAHGRVPMLIPPL